MLMTLGKLATPRRATASIWLPAKLDRGPIRLFIVLIGVAGDFLVVILSYVHSWWAASMPIALVGSSGGAPEIGQAQIPMATDSTEALLQASKDAARRSPGQGETPRARC
jgi:hypothetical protein